HIAPACLRDVLDFPLPGSFRKDAPVGMRQLSDLDEQVWNTLSREACIRLGKVVVETLRAAIPTLPAAVQNRLAPRPASGLVLEDLYLEQRTYNCLRQMLIDGQLHNVFDLGSKTIGELLHIKGFGAKCLVDLLASLESKHIPIAHGKDGQDNGPPQDDA